MTALRHLVFFVNARCNARCQFCCYGSRIAVGQPAMNLEEIGLIIGRLMYLETLVVTGGEPFLRRDIDGILRLFGGLATLREVSISTNGTLQGRVLDGVRAFLTGATRDVILRVRVSIDGPRDVHDRVRALPGCYDRAMSTLQALTDLSRGEPRLVVSSTTVVSSETLQTALQTARTIRREVDPDFVEVLPARPSVGFGDFGCPTPQEYARVEAEVSRRYHTRSPGDGLEGERSTRPAFRPRDETPSRLEAIALSKEVAAEIAHVMTTGRTSEPCHAGRAHAVLHSDGIVEPCEYIQTRLPQVIDSGGMGLQTRLGSVREHGYSIQAVLDSARDTGISQAVSRCGCLVPCALKMNLRERRRALLVGEA